MSERSDYIGDLGIEEFNEYAHELECEQVNDDCEQTTLGGSWESTVSRSKFESFEHSEKVEIDITPTMNYKVKKGRVVYCNNGTDKNTSAGEEFYNGLVDVTSFIVLVVFLLIPIPGSFLVGLLLVVFLRDALPLIIIGAITFTYFKFPAEFNQALSFITGG